MSTHVEGTYIVSYKFDSIKNRVSDFERSLPRGALSQLKVKRYHMRLELSMSFYSWNGSNAVKLSTSITTMWTERPSIKL